MTFDPFTLIAQIVNFVILLALLRVFLYRPVQRTMQARELRIAHEQASAEEARREARAEAEALRDERKAIEWKRRERLQEIEREAEALRERRFEEIEEEAAEAREAYAEALRRDLREARKRLRRRSAELVVDELRRALSELADASLERQTIRVFHQRLAEVEPDTLDALRGRLEGSPAVIATAFEASDEARAEATAAVREALDRSVDPSFEVDPDLRMGVALRIGGLEIGWSAQGWVDELEATFDDVVREVRGADGEEHDDDGTGADRAEMGADEAREGERER
ncbi:MAG: hypothetical protein U5J97_00380 [Trueperaceae bacterium]|nr:hypothetical protein [Trueperaceae bacterium]